MLPHANNLKTRTSPVRCIVMHSTGSGLAAHAERKAPYAIDPSKYEAAALEWYRSSGSEFFGHVMVGPTGARYDLAPLDKVALHSASLDGRYINANWREWARPIGGKSGWHRHGRDPAQVWDWWDARWPGVTTPQEFFNTRHINAISIGVDVLPLPDGTYTDAQVEHTAALVVELADVHGLAIRTSGKRPTVLGHEDIDPLRRGTKWRGDRIIGVGWDPGGKWPRERFNELVNGRAC